MLQIRMLLVEASGSSGFFLPLLWWHATPKEVWKWHRLFWSVTVTASEKLGVVATDSGEKVWALTWCLPYKAKPTGKKKKKRLMKCSYAHICCHIYCSWWLGHTVTVKWITVLQPVVSATFESLIVTDLQQGKKRQGHVGTTAIACYE